MSRNITRSALVPVILGTFALVACRGDGGTSPTPPPTLAQVLQEASLSAVPGSAAAIGIARDAVPASPVCSYDSGTQWFVCAPVALSVGTYTRSYMLLDASGTPQSHFGSAVAAVRSRSTMHGSSGTSGSIDMSDDMTLSGLLTGVHVLDGISTSDLTGPSLVTPSTNVTSHLVAHVNHLVLPSAPGGYPTGVITLDATSTTAGTVMPSVHVVIEYDGTSKMKMTTSAGSFSSTCVLDLASSAPTCLN